MSRNADRQETRAKLPRTPKGSGTRPDTGFSGPQRGFYSDVATVGASQKLGVSATCYTAIMYVFLLYTKEDGMWH